MKIIVKIEEENENKEVKEEQKIENNEIKNDTKNENDNKKKRKTWNNSEKKENIETNIEKEEQKSDNNIRGKRRTYNKEKEKSENNENNQDSKKENFNTENEQQKNKNEQKQIKKTNTLSTTFVPGSYTDKDKNNNADKDTSISSSENEKNIKAKSKKGISGLNIIEESQDFLKEMLNDVEQYNVGNILKGDLAEVFQDVIKDNADFKDNIFFVNVGHTEKKVGDLDKTKKMHTFKEFPKQELLSGYNSYDQLLKKYIDRAKRYKDEDK